MRKIISVILILCLCLSLAACNSDKKAYEASKLAYGNIDIAYKITEQYGDDLYEAWRLGINESEEILEDGAEHLATELSLSADEIRIGAAYAMATMTLGLPWDEISEETKQESINSADGYFKLMKKELFTFCVMSVEGAYIVSGKVEEAKTALDAAKAQMKELSKEYSDYEHYPNLKGYYTTTSSFFDFCNNPSGSFEQLKDTINNYRNEARDYISDLDYIFED